MTFDPCHEDKNTEEPKMEHLVEPEKEYLTLQILYSAESSMFLHYM